MRWVFLVCVGLMLSGCDSSAGKFIPQEGDVFFQDIDCGSYCDAIEKVTLGFNGCKTSHVGVYFMHNNTPSIIEARSIGVVITPLDSFLQRNVDNQGNPKVYVGRVNSLRQMGWGAIKERLLAELGKPYDNIYIPNDDKFYCSELVQETYLLEGKPLFQLEPMTFIDPESNETFENWAAYFDKLNVPIPEGKPGINPGGISRSKDITIVHFYGSPDGCQSSK